MAGVNYKRHRFDELMKFATFALLVGFAITLVAFKSSLAHDVTLLVIGLVSGKAMSTNQ